MTHEIRNAQLQVPFLASSAPSVTDDNTKGYKIGDLWQHIAVMPNDLYHCDSATTGGAVWTLVGHGTDDHTFDARQFNVSGTNVVRSLATVDRVVTMGSAADVAAGKAHYNTINDAKTWMNSQVDGLSFLLVIQPGNYDITGQTINTQLSGSRSLSIDGRKAKLYNSAAPSNYFIVWTNSCVSLGETERVGFALNKGGARVNIHKCLGSPPNGITIIREGVADDLASYVYIDQLIGYDVACLVKNERGTLFVDCDYIETNNTLGIGRGGVYGDPAYGTITRDTNTYIRARQVVCSGNGIQSIPFKAEDVDATHKALLNLDIGELVCTNVAAGSIPFDMTATFNSTTIQGRIDYIHGFTHADIYTGTAGTLSIRGNRIDGNDPSPSATRSITQIYSSDALPISLPGHVSVPNGKFVGVNAYKSGSVFKSKRTGHGGLMVSTSNGTAIYNTKADVADTEMSKHVEFKHINNYIPQLSNNGSLQSTIGDAHITAESGTSDTLIARMDGILIVEVTFAAPLSTATVGLFIVQSSTIHKVAETNAGNYLSIVEDTPGKLNLYFASGGGHTLQIQNNTTSTSTTKIANLATTQTGI